MWQSLTANLAVVALIVSSWNHAQQWFEGRPQILRALAFSWLMGVGTIASMLLSVELQPGVFFDLRSSLISTAAFFGGPLGAFVAGGIAALYRASMGGSGVWAGLSGIGLAAAIGLAGHVFMRGRQPAVRQLLVFSALVAAAPWIIFSVLQLTQSARYLFGLPIVALNFAATFVATFVIVQGRQWARDRDLLRTAFMQAPDFQYIKDAESRFVAVNQTVAHHHGYSEPGQMRGKSDRDLTAPERAEKLLAMERQMLASGEPIVNHEDEIDDPALGKRWFATSKAPIRDAAGEVIGLAGVTREVTRYKRLEQQLNAKNDQFLYALQEMSDGLAMFDSGGCLVLCNDQYRDLFPLTAHVRAIGTHIRTILAAVVETREQVGLPEDTRAWIDMVAASLSSDSEQEVHLYDGRWMRIRTRPTREGMAMVVVSEITKVKEAEAVAANLANQLRQLAGTDGLTGVLNRRAFDQALEGELARATRSGTPLSLLMIDVDHFKAFNDNYGHLAGDKCLQAVSQCLKRSTRTGGDTVARYGGEEFAVILADTDEPSAEIAAQKLRSAVRALDLPHKGSGKGILTISIGMATLPSVNSGIKPADLVAEADEALYEAKASGRDCVSRKPINGKRRKPPRLRAVKP
jgi:diguanylate cyclase (GGDEF)-like protein/PAS domain S-box-containing protein